MFCFKFEDEVKKVPIEEISPEPIQEAEETTISDSEVKREYKVRSSLMTKTEKQFFSAIKKALPESYILQPQVNLASVIKKTTEERYQNELFRNMDFAIFDLDYKPLALIEINDNTHITEKGRQARDYKVKDICKAANVPLIIFWTTYGVNEEYISKKIKEVLNLS